MKLQKTRTEKTKIPQKNPSKKEDITVKDVEIVNIRLPTELILFLDQLIEKGFYKTRSEAIREFVREYIQKKEHKRDAD